MGVQRTFRLVRSGSLWLYRAALLLVLGCGLLFSAVVLALRYWVLPHADDYRDRVAAALSAATGQQVRIEGLQGHWDGLHPRLSLRGLHVAGRAGGDGLDLGEVSAALSWYSLLAGELRFTTIELQGLDLVVRRGRDGRLRVAGVAVEDGSGGDGFVDWLLDQNHVAVRGSRVTWQDELSGTPPLALGDVEFHLDQFLRRHRFSLRASPPAEVGTPLDLRGDLRGRALTDPTSWQGRLYLNVARTDLAALGRWVPLPVTVRRGTGALALWLDLAAGRPTGGTVDLGVRGLQVDSQGGLPPLDLAALQGRLVWTVQGEEWTLDGRNLGFALADGMLFLPATFQLRHRRGADGPRTELEADHLEVAPALRLAALLPLEGPWRRQLAGLDPHGTVHGIRLAWSGAQQDGLPADYRVRAQFRDIGVSAAGAVPGMTGLSGSVEATPHGGSLTVTAGAGRLVMPGTFAEPLALSRLDARLAWLLGEGPARLRVDHLAVDTADAALRVSGTWQATGGAGTGELAGTISLQQGAQAWRYLPLVVRTSVRDWLRTALRAGSVREATFRLRGPLDAFPFRDPRVGLFEATGTAEGALIALGGGWPALQAVSGRLAFRGAALEVSDVRMSVDGTPLRGVQVQVPDLDASDPVLLARGGAQALTADLLRFLRDSPLRQRVGGYIEGWRVSGGGQLQLSLRVPLDHTADTTVDGTYDLVANALETDGLVPPVEALGGVLRFNQDHVSLTDAPARLYGYPARISVATQEGGAVAVQASGRIDVAGLRREIPAFLCSRLSGATDWRLAGSLRDRRLDYTITSDLVGLGSTWPAPLGKRAGDTLALRVERQQGSAQELLLVGMEGASAALQLDRAGSVRRGEVALGVARAPLPRRDGLWLSGGTARLDADQWRQVLDSGEAGATGFTGGEVHAGELRVFGRDLHDVQLAGSRGSAGWQLSISSREARGELQGGRPGGAAVQARFSVLQVPAAAAELDDPATRGPGEGRDLPAVDLVAEDFRFDGRQFGRLAMLAVPDGADWRLESLELSSPEGRAQMSGLWQAWKASPRTQLKVSLDVNDIGRYLARLKLPRGIAGGSGKLEGQLSWAGPPYALDVPSLSGSLRLEAHKGQFVRMDPGFGKLLGVLSLQALPRRVTLDFRDVFSQGFAFDQITGHADIHNGVVRTEDLQMAGPAARVELRGEVNLVAETQALQAKVLPALGDGVSLGAALVNPAVGLATFLAQKVFKNPIDQLFAFEYTINGTWTDPEVVPKKRRPAPQTPPGRSNPAP